MSSLSLRLEKAEQERGSRPPAAPNITEDQSGTDETPHAAQSVLCGILAVTPTPKALELCWKIEDVSLLGQSDCFVNVHTVGMGTHKCLVVPALSQEFHQTSALTDGGAGGDTGKCIFHDLGRIIDRAHP